MGVVALIMVFCFLMNASTSTSQHQHQHHQQQQQQEVIKVEGGPDSVIWVVQLSDLHFSVHNPDRALDFKEIVGPLLNFINPSLVLITGDLTDGKSKDLLTMKQNEDEWLEYQAVMDDVIKRSGLKKSIFYDLRGNHDNFGVPDVGGSFDFFSKYSINGQLGRRKSVNSVTVVTLGHRHLFVGLDSTMAVGLRGPTNLFGHPTDQLLAEIDAELSQWDLKSGKPVTKIAFGHFPISFSASSDAGNTLKNIFLKHSLSVYLCGHLHTRFGKNLKRHHLSSQSLPLPEPFQLNIHQMPSRSMKNCSFGDPPFKEFWEWEMGDWRKSRAMRILTIDNGHVSYMDIDFKSGAKKTIVVPTFPLDSRFMFSSLLHKKYECQHLVPPSFETIRALVFSVSPIMSVVARIYDARPGTLHVVMETQMTKIVGNNARGDYYAVPWNYKAFEDPSPDRFWFQIEAIDITGRSTLTELRPFSVSAQSAKISWTWKEFFVMGCQWASLYYPIFWSGIYFMLVILLVPKFLFSFSNKQYTYKTFTARKSFINCIAWILQELCKELGIWLSFIGYLIYLIVCPWLFGQVLTDSGNRTYMTYMGWVLKTPNNGQKIEYIGFPDVMVVVLPHLFFVVFPAIVLTGGLLAERSMCRDRFLSRSGKKEDDGHSSLKHQHHSNNIWFQYYERWLRYILLLACLAIGWKHFNNCRALVKAYDMNPLLHFPVYSLAVPIVLVYTFYKTKWWF